MPYLLLCSFRLPPEPFTVEMISSANEPTMMEITFKNKLDEDLFILKCYTPIEGLKSNLFTITRTDSSGKEECVKYKGILAKRPRITCANFVPVKEESYSIPLTEAYQFHEGYEYTIKYTRPLIYTSAKYMHNLSDYVPIYSVQSVSLQFKFKADKTNTNTAKQKQLNEEQQHLQQQSPVFQGSFNEETQAAIKEFHERCTNEYQKVREAVNDPHYSETYERWFGASDKDKVQEIYKKCLEGLRDSKAVCYHYETKDEDLYGWTYDNVRTIFITRLFEKLPKLSSTSGEDSQMLVIVQQLSQAFGLTDVDHGHSYNPQVCQHLAKHEPKIAVNSADNYGYFFCDVMLEVSADKLSFYCCYLL